MDPMPNESRRMSGIGFIHLPPHLTHLAPNGVLRTDQLPPLPKNLYFGEVKMLDKPEPIKPPKRPE